MSSGRPEFPSYYPERLTGPLRFGVLTPEGQVNAGVIDSFQSNDLLQSGEELFAEYGPIVQPSIIASAFANCTAGCSNYVHVTGDLVTYTHVQAAQTETFHIAVSEVERDPGETAVTLCAWKRGLHSNA